MKGIGCKLSFFLVYAVLFMACGKSDKDPLDTTPAKKYYAFVKSLINDETGLVGSTEQETYTTVYKNALAAMVFLLQDEDAHAENIFDFFKAHFSGDNFQGFTQFWNVQTGKPLGEMNYWEGDCSFLLIALNYYKDKHGSYGAYQELATGLANWLAERGNDYDHAIIAEGLIDIYAALKPWENTINTDFPDVFLKLQSAFLKEAVYAYVGDHIERAALTFGYLKGFDRIANFQKQEIWQYNGAAIQALSAFSTEDFINTEISAQNLLAWSLWKDSLNVNLSYLEAELNKMQLPGIRDTSSCGLPYLSAHATDHVMYDRPMIDPSCYMFFYYRHFNPMAPGKRSWDQDDDFLECEQLISQTGSGVKECHREAVGDTTFQITQSNSTETNELTYRLILHQNYGHPGLLVRYSDDVAGNTVKVYLGESLAGTFITRDSGGWEDFVWSETIYPGLLTAGSYTLKLVCSGGSYGVNLDVIKITE